MSTTLFWFLLLLYLIGIFGWIGSIIGISGRDRWPGIIGFFSGLAVWASAYTLVKVLPAPFSVLNAVVLHAAIPVAFALTAVFCFIYALEALRTRETVMLFGRDHWVAHTHTHTPAPAPAGGAAPAADSQWDYAVLFFILFLISAIISLSTGWGALMKVGSNLPSIPSSDQTDAIEEVVELASKIESQRGGKPLGASLDPFKVTLYPDEFPAAVLSDPMKEMFDPEIAAHGIKVKDITHVKFEENTDGTVDVVLTFTTEGVGGVPVPAGLERASSRLSAETGGDSDGWVRTNVLPVVRLVVDKETQTPGTTKFKKFPVRKTVNFSGVKNANTIALPPTN